MQNCIFCQRERKNVEWKMTNSQNLKIVFHFSFSPLTGFSQIDLTKSQGWNKFGKIKDYFKNFAFFVTDRKNSRKWGKPPPLLNKASIFTFAVYEIVWRPKCYWPNITCVCSKLLLHYFKLNKYNGNSGLVKIFVRCWYFSKIERKIYRRAQGRRVDVGNSSMTKVKTSARAWCGIWGILGPKIFPHE